jgi:CDP-2,3-bis-(O-geranylgeranyl)-sn-glycerol synthase
LLAAFLVAPDWATAVFTLPVLAVVAVMTPVLHVATNVAAYALGLKNEPW